MNYRTIGYIAGTHGLKGEVKVKVQTHFVNERFASGANVTMELHGDTKELTVQAAKENKGMLIVKFQGVSSIEEVEGWRSARLCVREDQLQELADDEIYYHDLLHMQVETSEHEVLGEVTEILETGAHVVIRVQGEKACLIPYVKQFIKEVDLKNKRLVVELLEGMI